MTAHGQHRPPARVRGPRPRGARLFVLVLLTVISSIGVPAALLAQQDEDPNRAEILRRMSLDDLFNAEVITVSKQPQKLSETAASIHVITRNEIRRSGARSLPEALRLAPNLRVAQVNSYAWVITARGFSSPFANKLLVMLDGRSLYTPLFAGVFWDIQNPLLDDVERIEVISGPGASLWGANAVNGVINIITRHARDTQGVYVTGTAGDYLHDSVALRVGAAGSTLAWRASVQRSDRGATRTFAGGEASDSWNVSQAAGRIDWSPSLADAVLVDAALYTGAESTSPGPARFNGRYVLARWSHASSPESDFVVQAYIDRTWRDDPPSTVTDTLTTSDVDVQQRRALARRHQLLWGGGYRLMRGYTPVNNPLVGFLPERRDMHLFSGFLQDEFALIPSRLTLTGGTKLEHNSFSGFEVQPTARVAWTAAGRQTLWSAFSRAVRTPSRIDVDYHIPAAIIQTGMPGVNGGPSFTAEKAHTYELGYRAEPRSNVTLSATAFHTSYGDLYSVESVNGTATYEIQNGTEGEAWGVEVSDVWRPANWWEVRAGYTYFHKSLRPKPGRVFDVNTLGNDPTHQVFIHTSIDLPGRWQLDAVDRFVSALPAPAVARFNAVDLRLGRTLNRWELAIVGQNLGPRHSEFGLQDIRPSVSASLSWSWSAQ